MQRTGAYKVRGAYYKVDTLSRRRTQARSHHRVGRQPRAGSGPARHSAGVPATIVMPATTPYIKVERTKALGAEVVLAGDVYDRPTPARSSWPRARPHLSCTFNDLGVATGQGTIAMEIVQELPLVDYILVPIGGGGLATGVSTLAKLLNPHIKVIGVEPYGQHA